MKSLFNLSCLAALLTLTAVSCQQDANEITTEALLIWTGPIAADGCGYFLQIDGEEHKPSNEEIIPESFQQSEQTPVIVRYRQLEEPVEYSCGMMPTRYNSTMEIISIERRN